MRPRGRPMSKRRRKKLRVRERASYLSRCLALSSGPWMTRAESAAKGAPGSWFAGELARLERHCGRDFIRHLGLAAGPEPANRHPERFLPATRRPETRLRRFRKWLRRLLVKAANLVGGP